MPLSYTQSAFDNLETICIPFSPGIPATSPTLCNGGRGDWLIPLCEHQYMRDTVSHRPLAAKKGRSTRRSDSHVDLGIGEEDIENQRFLHLLKLNIAFSKVWLG